MPAYLENIKAHYKLFLFNMWILAFFLQEII